VTAAGAGRSRPEQADPASKSARTRTRIMDAAARVLSATGYAGTRLADVAEQAGLQAPAIYYHFSSREDLIEEVMWAGIADMRRHVGAALDKTQPDVDPLDRVLTAVEAHLRHELQISDYATASIRNAGQVPASIRRRQLVEEAAYGELWRDLIRTAAAAGRIRAGLDLYVAQMLVFGALNWTAEWWNPRRGSIDAVVANAQLFIRHGLGVPLDTD
jgi:TetR/AcrR family transcriptional regulator, cholesterol catabolism regulator